VSFSGNVRVVGKTAQSVYTGNPNATGVLIVNLDLTSTVYIGGDVFASEASVQIPPLGSTSFDGTETLFAICPTAQIDIQVIPGGQQWSPSAQQIAEQISLLGINVNINNFEITPSGDITGTTDTAAINGALNADNAYVFLGPTTVNPFYISGLFMNKHNVTLTGAGKYATNIEIVTPGSQNGVSAGIFANSDNCTIRDLTVSQSNSNITSNTASNGIEVCASGLTFENLFFEFINGYGIENLNQNSSGSFQNNSDYYWANINGTCAGGVHMNGNATGNTGGVMINVGINSGVSTGPTANLDCFLIESSADDIQMFACGGNVNAGTGSIYHVRGHVAPLNIVGGDIGINSQGSPCMLIENDASSLFGHDIYVSDVIFTGGTHSVVITGGFSAKFKNCTFNHNTGDGVQVSGSGVIYFEDCEFGTSPQHNGSGASGSNYDLNWSGTSTGKVTNCNFGSPIENTGTAGVQYAVNIASGGQNVTFNRCSFLNANLTLTKTFTNGPLSVRSCEGYNPVGPITMSVPNSGSDTTAQAVDATFIFTAATGNLALSIEGSSNVNVPAGQVFSVFVPAGQVIEVGYSNAPTLTVLGY